MADMQNENENANSTTDIDGAHFALNNNICPESSTECALP